MSIYVDDFRARYGRMIMCHMIADSDEELRSMANKIGVAQKWHQGDHFDISLSKRALAVAAGAREITVRQLAHMATNRRFGWPMGTPETAEAISRERRAARRGGQSTEGESRCPPPETDTACLSVEGYRAVTQAIADVEAT